MICRRRCRRQDWLASAGLDPHRAQKEGRKVRHVRRLGGGAIGVAARAGRLRLTGGAFLSIAGGTGLLGRTCGRSGTGLLLRSTRLLLGTTFPRRTPLLGRATLTRRATSLRAGSTFRR